MAKHGIYHKNIGKRHVVHVYSDGHEVMKYVCKKINSEFSSPMVNNKNLHFVGGWFWPKTDSIDAIKRVSDGHKPMAKIYPHGDEDLEEAMDALRRSGLYYTEPKKAHIDGLGQQIYHIKIANEIMIDEYFDLDSWKRDWEKYLGKENLLIERAYTDFKNNPSLTYWADIWDDTQSFLITGLILGYPLWSTASCLRGHE